jgi:hypothetical protein
MLLAGFALLAVLAAPAQGAINQPRPFEADYPYAPGFDAGSLDIVSGRMEADLGSTTGTFGFFNATGAVVTGLRQACWSRTQCTESSEGEVAIAVRDGGSFSLRLPDELDATVDADHALGIFMDFGGDDNLNSLALGRSLVAPMVEGVIDFQRITPIPRMASLRSQADGAGGLAALDDATIVDVYRGATLIASRPGKVDPVLFTGNAAITPFTAESAILPFAGSSIVNFEPASQSAARAGLELGRLKDLSAQVKEAETGSAAGQQEADPELGGFDDLLAEVLNGAVLGLPNGNGSFAEAFVLVRFSILAVEAEGTGLQWRGRAALQMEEGDVKGAKPLHGYNYLALPWWSYVLWAIALTILIVRLALRSPRRNEHWDRLRWIGWIATPVALLIVFLLWDHETNAVWGTSILTTDAGGRAFVMTMLVQLIPLSLVMFAAAAPLRLLFRNGFMLAGQGTFMNLAGAAGTIIGYFVGAHLLLSYLELILSQVIEQLG